MSNLFALNTQPPKAAAKPAKVAPKDAKTAVVEQPKAKRSADSGWPIGTELGKFTSWEVIDGKLAYTDKKRDLKAFNAAFYAALEFGNKDKNTMRGAQTGSYWSTAIAQFKAPKHGFATEIKGDKVNVGTMFHFFRVGAVITATELKGSIAVAEKVEGDGCGVGLRGGLLGLVSCVGPAFSNWTDFLYFSLLCQETKNDAYAFHIDQTCNAKFNLVRDTYTHITRVDMTNEVCPADGKVHVVFTASVSSSGLRKFKKGWVPFVPGYTGSSYFCGLVGYYALTDVQGYEVIVSAHDKHFHNYVALYAYLALKSIPLRSPLLLSRALEQKDTSISAPVIKNLGLSILGLADPSEDKPQCEPSKVTYNYECTGHKDWKKKKPFVLEDAEEAKGSELNPVIISHKKVGVISAYTVELNWSDLPEDEVGWAWRSTCLTCKKFWYVNPYQLLNESLVAPVKLAPKPAPRKVIKMDEGEEDEEDQDRDKEKEKEPEEAPRPPPPPKMDEGEEEEEDSPHQDEDDGGEASASALGGVDIPVREFVFSFAACSLKELYFYPTPPSWLSSGSMGYTLGDHLFHTFLTSLPTGAYFVKGAMPEVKKVTQMQFSDDGGSALSLKQEVGGKVKTIWWTSVMTPFVLVVNGRAAQVCMNKSKTVNGAAVVQVDTLAIEVNSPGVIVLLQALVNGLGTP